MMVMCEISMDVECKKNSIDSGRCGSNSNECSNDSDYSGCEKVGCGSTVSLMVIIMVVMVVVVIEEEEEESGSRRVYW